MPMHHSVLSRRNLLAGGAALAITPLASCGSSGASSGTDDLVMWDMVWGTGAAYTKTAQKIAGEYTPAEGHRGVTYQSIPWANWYQTFTSAVASGTGPSVSTGASFQPFFFMEQGSVVPADGAVALLEKEGKADFLPGLLDAMKTDKGYAGIPWGLDLRVLWYRESMLEDVGASVPTTWDEYVQVGKKLKAAGKIGFGLAAGSSTTDAQHSIFALLINNGGGLFTEDGEPDATNDANVEALEFVLEMVAEGIIDPRAASYTADNLDSDWASGRIAMGFGQTGLDKQMKDPVSADLKVMSPLASTSGSKGTIYYINAIMLYADTPDQASSDAFAAWWATRTDTFWTENVMIDLPVTQRLASSEMITSNPNLVTAIKEWQPIGKTLGAKAPAAFGALNSVDGGKAAASFVQQVVQGKTAPKAMLQTLQTELEKLV
ncbi:extracellular solute-binding protein [Brachybacterium sp. MASK1Z-5]|uniref:Extracellular solute-binding protein n=1 Tax=Brachybacterium halotolerans TaxID=2795215 RepID=A0ABS1BG60_9MICO|nr:extracellular solute-binding protein [Brachybacterium halotolerans]MBK0333025.1 extracellular solute-binding protein [Brachybacterium halotolerans]